jgi:peptidyl-prolyl cis-trans isomerase B (cyclophilin B)
MPTRRRIISIAIAAVPIVFVLALAACTPSTPASDTAPNAESQPVPGEEPLHVSTQKVAGDETAVVTTSKGIIKFRFFAKDAPNTVASFIELANKKFYDGTKWHRVVPNFVIQGGDPLSKKDDPAVGSGGPGWRIKGEFGTPQPDGTFVPAHKHLEGSVAMARATDPNSAGSQSYICLAPQPSLDGQYTVFGQVVSGLDVVHRIAQGDVIKSIRIQHGK